MELHYPDAMTIRDARQQYFDQHGLGDGGYDDKWVALKVGPIPMYFPNTPARVRAVRLHDIHHALTAYDTSWRGEAQIGAWEVASSCAQHYAAWFLNLAAMALGLYINPRQTFRAFLRGRYSGNLYAGQFHEPLLEETVGTLRQRLRLDRQPPRPSMTDVAAFIGWSVVSLATGGLTLLIVLVPLIVVGLILTALL